MMMGQDWAKVEKSKVDKGFTFQVHVAQTLLSWGYLEGQISMRPPTPPEYKHKPLLKEQGLTHYSSPDIMVINSWMAGPKLQWKFGLCCSYRTRLWEECGLGYITIPFYQAEEYKRIEDEKKLTLYWAMGQKEDPATCEIRFMPVTAPWITLKIKDHAAQQAGRPQTKFAGFDWDAALTKKKFAVERLKKGDHEIEHVLTA